MATAIYGAAPIDIFRFHAQNTIESHRVRTLLGPSGANSDPIRDDDKEPHPHTDSEHTTADSILPVAIIGAGKQLLRL